MNKLTIPTNLAAAAERQGWQGWLAALPATLSEVARRWALDVGEPFQPGGASAWVAPAMTAGGQALVLKLVWPHPEAAHEADGLRLWEGRGTVVLHAAEEIGQAIALLVERCHPGVALSSRPEAEQDNVIATLLRRLWVEPPPGHRFHSLGQMCAEWADEFEAKASAGLCPLDPGLARAGMELFRQLPTNAQRTAVLCTDLHAGNVLAARREPWLVIDPKPHVGDPTYDVLQHMLNCPTRLHAEPLALLHRMARLAGLEPERTRLWLFARCVQESPDWPGVADVARQLAPP